MNSNEVLNWTQVPKHMVRQEELLWRRGQGSQKQVLCPRQQPPQRTLTQVTEEMSAILFNQIKCQKPAGQECKTLLSPHDLPHSLCSCPKILLSGHVSHWHSPGWYGSSPLLAHTTLCQGTSEHKQAVRPILATAL